MLRSWLASRQPNGNVVFVGETQSIDPHQGRIREINIIIIPPMAARYKTDLVVDLTS